MTGEMGCCCGRNILLLQVVPEVESVQYAVARGGTARSLMDLGGFRGVFEDLWTA
jgi:hypothetical protein